MIDKIFGVPKIVKDLQTQVKALQRTTFGMQINASTAIFPNYSVIQDIDTYCTVDDIYSIISLLAETAARIPMYGYEIVNEPSLQLPWPASTP
jgi:phage portal protein BeeE